MKNDRSDRNHTFRSGSILLGLIGTVMVFCLSVTLVLHLRQIFYLDIRLLNLSREVGLDDWIIRENYDILINYNLITKQVPVLVFPSFPMSEGGRIHFEEVRRIFYGIQYLGIGCTLLFAAGFLAKSRKHDYTSLKWISILTVGIPLVLGTLVALDWERFFIGFHELFFDNDYWLFDPATDPVIDMLPDAFFLHCAVAILVFILLGSALSGFLYRYLSRRSGK